MKDTVKLQAELARIEDLADTLGLKIHNLAGNLELICLGLRTLNKIEDSYELCSLRLVLNYVEMIETLYILKLQAKVSELKEMI